MTVVVVVASLVVWALALFAGIGGAVHILPVVGVGYGVFQFLKVRKARQELAATAARNRKADQAGMMRKALESRPKKPSWE